MRIREIDAFLNQKGFSEDKFDDCAPYEVLRMIENFNPDIELREALITHFSHPEFAENEAEKIMSVFERALDKYLAIEQFESPEDAKPLFALLDVIFSWGAWMSFAGEPQEFGLQFVFREIDEKLHLIANAVGHLECQGVVAELSEIRGAPTTIAAVLPKLDPDWLNSNFHFAPILLSNNPDLPVESVIHGINGGILSLVFHPNAPRDIAISRINESLDENPDELIQVLDGWQSMPENGLNLISYYPNWNDHQEHFEIIDQWLQENDEDIEVADFVSKST